MSLERLPPDVLILIITSGLRPLDYRNLRLTSKKLAAQLGGMLTMVSLLSAHSCLQYIVRAHVDLI